MKGQLIAIAGVLLIASASAAQLPRGASAARRIERRIERRRTMD